MFKEWIGRLGFFFFFLETFKEWVGKLDLFFKCEIQYLGYIRTVTVYKNNIYTYCYTYQNNILGGKYPRTFWSYLP